MRDARTDRSDDGDDRSHRGIRLVMSLVDADGNVLASADEPFELGRFDLAAARQGMRKMLEGLGGIDS